MRRRLATLLFVECMLLAGGAGAGEPSVGQLDGQPIEAGATIEVPAGTVKNLVLFGGARVSLLPGASAIVSSPNWFPPEKGPKSIRGGRLYLKSGEAIVGLPAEGAFAVTAAGGQTMLLWRGVTRVTVNDGDMGVEVDDGAAYVGAQDRWLRLNTGAVALIAKKSEPQVFKGRLQAPQTTPCPDGGLAVSFTGDNVPVKLCWNAVPGATSYRVELAKDEAMSQLVETLDVTGPTAGAEPKLAPGRYFARVLAIGAEHVTSIPSAPRALGVARATLPSGAFVAPDGAIVMAKDSTVVIDTPGLLVTSAGGFDVSSALANALAGTPAPAAGKLYGLNGYRARVVRLRDPSGAEARLSFVLRELHARVEMTPAKPRWPENPIDVSVVLEDASKRVDLGAEPVTLEVAVDATVVPVNWTRNGNVFRARIAPVDGPGPFLVRVSAKDQTGNEIGAHILDIDGRRAMKDLEKDLNRRRPK